MQLTDFKVLTFDCYGTLIDWETGMFAAYHGLLAKSGGAFSRDQMLEMHARHEADQEAKTPAMPYSELLAVVYSRVAREMGIETAAEENARFGASVPYWPAFDDSAGALQYLKKYFKLAILSNVDRKSFAGSNRRLQVEFDYIFTAEDIGSYKPSLRNFDYLIEKLAASGIHKHEILHTAESLFHDHLPANKVGLASAWIHRRHDQQGFGATRPPDTMPHYDFKFTSMAEMAQAHQNLAQPRFRAKGSVMTAARSRTSSTNGLLSAAYGTSSEYLRELIRKDQDRLQLRGLLLAGAKSAPTKPVDEGYFDGLRRKVQATWLRASR